MPIKVQCAGCGKKLKAKDKHAGRQVRCPDCRHPIAIPSAAPMESARWSNQARSLDEALDLDSAPEISRFMLGMEFHLIKDPELSDRDELAALTAEPDDFDFPAMVAFTTLNHAEEFINAVPHLYNSGESVSVFILDGKDMLAGVPSGFGLLLDPETDDGRILPPDLIEEIKSSKPQRARPEPARSPDEQRLDRHANSVRDHSFNYLRQRGFQPANWLPLPDVTAQLRPESDIAARLLALAAVFTWTSAPEDAVATKDIRRHIKSNRLRHWLTEDEFEIVRMDRSEAHAEHVNMIGWRLENMWPLAWTLGYETTPGVYPSEEDNDICRDILFEFLAGTDDTINDLVSRASIRPRKEVIIMEDRFYCAHNAVRSAQLGNMETVPEGFHPIEQGGAVHERRHSLTWCLSPGTDWAETDLST